MYLKFTKMHGLGNDFMVIDGVSQTVQLESQQIKQWADRHLGIGFDQCLLIEPSTQPEVDFYYRIFNADGSEVGQCGNGARCIARFLQEQGLTQKNPIRVATQTSQLSLQLNPDQTVTVDMGCPQLAPEAISLLISGKAIEIHAVNVGNPHAILWVDNVTTAPVTHLGPTIATHAMFPQGANVSFLQRVDQQTVKLRVYERGSGETLACASAACAAVVAGCLAGKLSGEVTVELPGGCLSIRWAGTNNPILMTGPAVTVYAGQIKT